MLQLAEAFQTLFPFIVNDGTEQNYIVGSLPRLLFPSISFFHLFIGLSFFLLILILFQKLILHLLFLSSSFHSFSCAVRMVLSSCCPSSQVSVSQALAVHSLSIVSTCLCPPRSASERGVKPHLSVGSGLTLHLYKRNVTHSLCPSAAARWRGVLPS